MPEVQRRGRHADTSFLEPWLAPLRGLRWEGSPLKFFGKDHGALVAALSLLNGADTSDVVDTPDEVGNASFFFQTEPPANPYYGQTDAEILADVDTLLAGFLLGDGHLDPVEMRGHLAFCRQTIRDLCGEWSDAVGSITITEGTITRHDDSRSNESLRIAVARMNEALADVIAWRENWKPKA